MTNKELITSFFNEFVDHVYKDKHDLHSYFKKHPAKDKAIEGFCRELQLIELKRLDFTRSQIRKYTWDFFRTFCMRSLNIRNNEVTSNMHKKTQTYILDEYGNKVDKSKELSKGPDLPDGVLLVDRATNKIIEEN